MADVPDPTNGAGLVDSDPDQTSVMQDPSVVMVGDIAALPEAEPSVLLMVNDKSFLDEVF